MRLFQTKKQKEVNQEIQEVPDQVVVDNMSVTRYTYDVWEKCQHGRGRKDWETVTMPNSVSNFLSQAASNFTINFQLQHGKVFDESKLIIENIKIVTLDEEYFEWLEKRKNTENARTDYTSTVSDEDALRLAKKHDLHYSYSILVYPIPMTKEEMIGPKRRVLSRKTQMELTNYIKGGFPDTEVYTLPYVLNMMNVEEDQKQILKTAKTYFDTEKHVGYAKWEMVAFNEDEQLPLYGIPIVLREEHNTMVFNLKEVMNSKEPEMQINEHLKLHPLSEMSLMNDVINDFGLSNKNSNNENMFYDSNNLYEYCANALYTMQQK